MKAQSFQIRTIKSLPFVTALLFLSACLNQKDEPSDSQLQHQHQKAHQHAHSLNQVPDPDFDVRWEGQVPKLYLHQGDGKQIFLIKLKILKAGTRYYRWNAEAEADRVDRLGHLSGAETEQKVDENSGFLQGGGWYFSTNPWDSQRFGQKLLIAEAPKDLLIVNQKLLLGTGIFGFSVKSKSDYQDLGPRLNGINRGLSAAGVHGSIDVKKSAAPEEGWLCLFHPDAVSSIQGDSHPWVRGHSTTFHKFIRGERISGQEAHQLPHLIDILEDTIAKSDHPGIETLPVVKRIRKHFRPELIEAFIRLVDAFDSRRHPQIHFWMPSRDPSYDEFFNEVKDRLHRNGIAEEEVLKPQNRTGNMPGAWPER